MLLNFPLVNQLQEATSDGQADENARNNCVPASIASGASWYLKHPYNGDQLKDAVYGQGYTGTMSASHFVSYLAGMGLRLSPVSGTQAGLVSTLHSYLKRGIPALVTMPSQWGTAPADPVHPSGYTHVGICCGEASGTLTVMNPWGGFFQTQSDAWWQARLCFGQIWPLEKINMATTPTGWTDDGTWLSAPNGIKVGTGFRYYILNNPWDPSNWPVSVETSVAQVELANTQHGAGTVQYFRFAQLSWSKSENKVFPTRVGGEADFMRNQIGALNVRLNAANTATDLATKQLAAALASLTQAQSAAQAARAAQADAEAKLAASQAAQTDAQSAVTSLKKAMGL